MIRSNRKSPAEGSALPLECCLAKTRDDSMGRKAGIDVFGHCVIVGEVARALIEYTIPAVRKRLFPTGSELIAAAHDVGKICPSFRRKYAGGPVGTGVILFPALRRPRRTGNGDGEAILR